MPEVKPAHITLGKRQATIGKTSGSGVLPYLLSIVRKADYSMATKSPEARRPTLDRTHPLFPWAVWALGALLFFYAFFHRVAPAVMVNELMRDFAVGGAILGTLSAFYFYPYAALQIPLGLMLDKWGPRRVLTVAAAFCGLGSLVFATADNLVIAYVGRAMIGAGSAFGWIGTLTLISIWFPRHQFSLLAGLTAMIGMSGAVGGQAPLATIIHAFGWRETLSVAALYGGILAIAFWLIVRDPAGSSPKTSRQTTGGTIWNNLREVLSEVQIWYVGFILAMVSLPLLTFASLWGVPYMMSAYGMTRTEAASSTSLLLIGWAIGAPLFGWLSDRIRSRKIPLLFSTMGSTAAILALVYVPGLPVNAVLFLIFFNGFAGGAAVIAYATGREHIRPAVSGATMGTMNCLTISVSAVFQPVMGWILDLFWDGRMEAGARIYSIEAYQMAFLCFAVCGVAAIIASILVKETECRQIVGN